MLSLIQLLRPQATLWACIETQGNWAVSFRMRDDLLFCWVEEGDCLLLRPANPPLQLRTHDFVLVRTSTPFTLASSPCIEPVSSDDLISAGERLVMHVGDDEDRPRCVLRGGRFLFATANESLLTGMLPQVMGLNSGDMSSSVNIHALLTMNARESQQQSPGSQFFVSRLMELTLLETLRWAILDVDVTRKGLLAGLADPKLAPALNAIHTTPAQQWTVSSLARHCGLSRSGFAHRFSTVLGMGAIEYLQQWRIVLAKDALQSSTVASGEIALRLGFQSASAFSSAFKRLNGCSPKAFRESSTSTQRTYSVKQTRC